MSDDPMADFLAREKAALGDDADLFAGGQAPSAPGGLDDFASFETASPTTPAPTSAQPPASSSANIDDSDGLGDMSAFPDISSGGAGGAVGNSNVRVTGAAGLGEDEDREKFESSFPDLSGEVGYESAPKPVFNALAPQPYGASPYPTTSATSAPKSPSGTGVLPAPTFSNTLPSSNEDSEPIKAWRAKQAEEIKARDERDRAARDAMRGKAEKAIDEFYEGYNKVKERNIRENKENEASFLEKLSEGTAKGTSWERVTALIELENSQSKTIRPSMPGGSDLARMKEILLALKREGDKAPGAAGF